MKARAENKKGRGPLHNLALRPRPVQLQVRRPGAESRKARELTRNLAALPAVDRLLAVDKRNQRVERKRASKFLQPPALNNTHLIWVKQRPWSDPGPVCVHRFL